MSIFVVVEVGILSTGLMQSLEMTPCEAPVFVAALLDQSYNAQNVFSPQYNLSWYGYLSYSEVLGFVPLQTS